MKTKKIGFTMVFTLLLFISGLANAADANYKRTSVWRVNLITTEYGQMDPYLDSLKSNYTTAIEEAKKQGMVLSYKILTGVKANPEDWDVMILIEFANWASLDTMQAKMDAINTKLYGSMEKSDDNAKKQNAERTKIRAIFGGKLMQEIQFVK